MIRLLAFWDKLRTNYWFLPALMAVAATALALGLVDLDRSIRPELVQELAWVYSGGPEGARGVLSTIAGSVMGVAGTTFSITIAVLSLASGQYGPRLLRGFMRDRGNQIVLGTFTSTFLYCLLVLRTVRGTDETTYVPHVSVTVGIFLAVVNVFVLIFFINHVAESIQVSRIIDKAGDEADAAISRLFPEGIGKPVGEMDLPTGPSEVLRSTGSGYVVSIDDSTLLSIAAEKDVVIQLVAVPGDHIIFDMPLLKVWPAVGAQGDDLEKAFTLSRARTSFQDAEHALMQLAEVGVRAMSPGINDPFTAMACIDRLGVVLCKLAARQPPPPYRHDERGTLRVLAEPYSYSRLVTAAFGYLRQAATDQPAVRQRLQIVLGVVLGRTDDPGFADALRHELDELQR